MEPTSNAAEWTLEEAVVALPRRNASGVELCVRIRALKFSEVQRLWNGTPSAASVASGEAPPADPAQRAKSVQEIVRLGAIEPRIAFEPGEDGVPSEAVHPDNLAALCCAIMAHSGVGLGGEAAAVLGFRYVERGGVALGGRDGGPVPAGEAAA